MAFWDVKQRNAYAALVVVALRYREAVFGTILWYFVNGKPQISSRNLFVFHNNYLRYRRPANYYT